MGKRNIFFFWLGGVLTETALETTLKTISPHRKENITFQGRLLFLALCEDLSLGKIDAHAFCRRAVELSGLQVSTDELEVRIMESIAVRTPVLEVIERLPGYCQKWLISDYPHEWYQFFADRVNLHAYFPQEQVIFTDKAHLQRLDPDIFYYIVQRADRPIDACVIVDSISSRAMHAVRHGLSSTIYVDPARLIRDLTLRGILSSQTFRIHQGI